MAVVSKGVKNFGSKLLDMSSAARRKRAKGLGFDPDEVWYHGTPRDFDEFKGGDPSFFTQNHELANRFSDMAEGGEPKVMPVLLRPERTFDYRNTEQVDEVVSALKAAGVDDYDDMGRPRPRKLSEGLLAGDYDSIEDLDVQDRIRGLGYDSFYVREISEPEAYAGAERIKSGPFDGSPEGKSAGMAALRRERERHARFGDKKDRTKPAVVRDGDNIYIEHQGSVAAGDHHDKANSALNIAMLHPEKIRSVNAAFDPAKKESRNLLASLAPVGIGTTVAAGGLLAPEEAEASVTGKLSKELAQRLAPHSQLLDAVVNERDSGIILDKLVVPKDQRGGGVGGRFMDDLTAYADESGKPLALTAAGDFGGTKAGQRRFYKRHGFVDNKGRNKDYEFSENMIRPAVVGGAAVASGGTIADEVAEQMDPARTRPGSFLLHGQGMENSMIPNHAGAMMISQGLDAIEDRTVPVLRPFLPTEHLGDVAEDKWAQGRASSALDKFLVWVDTI